MKVRRTRRAWRVLRRPRDSKPSTDVCLFPFFATEPELGNPTTSIHRYDKCVRRKQLERILLINEPFFCSQFLSACPVVFDSRTVVSMFDSVLQMLGKLNLFVMKMELSNYKMPGGTRIICTIFLLHLQRWFVRQESNSTASLSLSDTSCAILFDHVWFEQVPISIWFKKFYRKLESAIKILECKRAIFRTWVKP